MYSTMKLQDSVTIITVNKSSFSLHVAFISWSGIPSAADNVVRMALHLSGPELAD